MSNALALVSLRVAGSLLKSVGVLLFVYVVGLSIYAWYHYGSTKSKLLTYGLTEATASLAATAVMLLAAALPAYGLLRIVTMRGRIRDCAAALTLPLISWGMVQLPANFDARTGEALKWCAERPDGTLFCLDHPGTDPLTQRQLTPIDQNRAEVEYRKNRGLLPKRITKPISDVVFFDPLTAQPKVWVTRNARNCFDLFDSPGADPQTGQNLQPVTKGVVPIIAQCSPSSKAQKFCADRPDGTLFCLDHPGIDPLTQRQLTRMDQARADIEFRRAHGLIPQRITAPQSAIVFFDPLSASPKVWVLKNDQGCYDLFDNPGIHPQTGDPLEPVTKIIVRAITECAQREIEKSNSIRDNEGPPASASADMSDIKGADSYTRESFIPEELALQGDGDMEPNAQGAKEPGSVPAGALDRRDTAPVMSIRKSSPQVSAKADILSPQDGEIVGKSQLVSGRLFGLTSSEQAFLVIQSAVPEFGKRIYPQTAIRARESGLWTEKGIYATPLYPYMTYVVSAKDPQSVLLLASKVSRAKGLAQLPRQTRIISRIITVHRR